MYEVQWHGYEKGKKVKKKHGHFSTYDEAYASIIDWWKKHDFTPPYVRVYTRNGDTTLDYGNHHCFYHIIKVD